MEGFSRSVTMTVNDDVLLNPAASVTEHVTGVAPLLKLCPEGGLQTGVPIEWQLSETEGRP